MDMDNWMRDLPSELHNIPLTWLSIPGSHDSFSCSITTHSDIGPDEPRLKCLNHCLCFNPLIKRLVFHWSQTQVLTCQEQLTKGIRYLDFRLAARIGTLTPYVVHGLYGANFIDILLEIATFLDAHSSEVVLLDMQHFYDFTDKTHEYMLDSAQRIFSSKLCPYSTQPSDLTLAQLWTKGYQVIIVYRDPYASSTSYVWPSKCMPNPWLDTAHSSRLIALLEENYQKGRDPNLFYVTQGVLTPDLTYVLLRLYTTLRRNLAPEAHRVMREWISTKVAGKGGINIVITDFIGMPPFNFSEYVVALNLKLMETMKLGSK